MICKSRLCVLPSVIVFLLLASLVPVAGVDTPTELIAQADLAYMTRHIEEDMTDAIALFEAVIPDLDTLSIETQAYVLNRLSQLYYEATMFIDGNSPEDAPFFEKGKAYGLQSLRLNAQFFEAEVDNFDEAVAYATDATAMLWTADNWGELCGMNPIIGLFQQNHVLTLFARSLEIDPTLLGGSASNALGSLLILSPAAMGGDEEAGLALLESAIDIDPSYLSNQVILAEYWGFTYNFLGQMTGIRDAELVERLLNQVLDADIGDWPFWNRNAKQSAEALLATLEEMRD